MDVLLVTIFVSLCLAAFFAAAFWLERAGGKTGGIERDALLPLEEGRASGSRRAGTEAVPVVDPAEARGVQERRNSDSL